MRDYYSGMKSENIKPSKKIMLHVRALNQISGPNVSNRIIYESALSEKFHFDFLEHNPAKGILDNLMIIPSLIRQIRRFNPDIVHVSGLLRSGFEAVIASRICRKKVLLTIRGSSIDAIEFNKKFLYGNIIEPLTMRLSHKVYAVCNAMANRDYVRKHTKGRMVNTIHNIAPDIKMEEIEPFGLRKQYGIDNDTVVVAIVGRMVYDKGLSFVKEAINEINSKDIVFVFVGDGPYMSILAHELSNEISCNRVFLLGKQNNVLSILKESDIFLFATLHENLSNALLEACSMGLAVIATSVGGNPEVINDGHNGILISPANSEEIVKAVKLLAFDKPLRELLGKNAIKTMKEEFSQTKLLRRLEKVYVEI